MTANDIHDAIETFARYGVPRERIFNEVMRARYLDYVLFLNPENVQYGISIDDLYENMKRTADKLGMYEGDADTYARVYTLALRVEPLVFATEIPTAPAKVHALLAEAVKKAEAAGMTKERTNARIVEKYKKQDPAALTRQEYDEICTSLDNAAAQHNQQGGNA